MDVRNAENLRGYLGPILVIGVKIARLAKKILNINENEQPNLHVLAKLPLVTPFSCILDGIQATTQCTVGNRKLIAETSEGSITAILNSKVKIKL